MARHIPFGLYFERRMGGMSHKLLQNTKLAGYNKPGPAFYPVKQGKEMETGYLPSSGFFGFPSVL